MEVNESVWYRNDLMVITVKPLGGERYRKLGGSDKAL